MPNNGLSLQMTGDWKKAAILLRNLETKLTPYMEGVLYEKGEFVLEKLKEHIDRQDLNWTPLSERTVVLKGGDKTIYVETGYLRDNLVVRRLKSTVKGSTIIIGASPWKTHENGEKMSNIMMWLEYGTDKMPPRPLLRPTFDEIKPLMEKAWKEALKEFIDKGGSE